jgi:hypothetical protein
MADRMQKADDHEEAEPGNRPQTTNLKGNGDGCQARCQIELIFEKT